MSRCTFCEACERWHYKTSRQEVKHLKFKKKEKEPFIFRDNTFAIPNEGFRRVKFRFWNEKLEQINQKGNLKHSGV